MFGWKLATELCSIQRQKLKVNKIYICDALKKL